MMNIIFLGIAGPRDLLVLASLYLLLSAFSIYHLLRNKEIQGFNYILYLLLILVFPVIGSLIYLGTKLNKSHSAFKKN